MLELLLLATAYGDDSDAKTTAAPECSSGTYSVNDSDLKRFESCQALGLDCYPGFDVRANSSDYSCKKVATASCAALLTGYDAGNSGNPDITADACSRTGAMMGLACEYSGNTCLAITGSDVCASVVNINNTDTGIHNPTLTDNVCNLIPDCMGPAVAVASESDTCVKYVATTFNGALVGETGLKAATVSKICEGKDSILGFDLTEKAYSFQCDTGTKYKTCEDIKDPALCTEAGLFSLEMERESDDGTKTTTGDTCIRKEMIEADAEVDAADPVCEAKACDEIAYKEVSKPSSDATGVVNVAGFGTDNIETFCAALGCKVSEDDPTTKCSSASRLVVGLITGLFVAAFI